MIENGEMAGARVDDGRRLLVAPTMLYLPMTLALVTGALVEEGAAIAAAVIAFGVGGLLRWMARNHLRHHHEDAGRHFGFFTTF